MARICYQVLATLPDRDTANEYVAWLQQGHSAAVIAGGAESAMVARLDPEAPIGTGAKVDRVLTQYIFASRSAFDAYVRDHAPALRAEGATRFGRRPGVSFQRWTGEIQ